MVGSDDRGQREVERVNQRDNKIMKTIFRRTMCPTKLFMFFAESRLFVSLTWNMVCITKGVDFRPL